MRKKLNCYLTVGLFVLFIIPTNLSAQHVLKLDDAIDVALNNSPNIKRSKLNLERSRESLNAQNASLNSKFSLQITPFEFRKDRTFNDFNNTWNTSETRKSSGVFSITQPIVYTDGVLSLNNRFGWQDSRSEFQGGNNKSFSNNLFLSYSQPIFTYNRTRLQLSELELDFENTSLSYAIQKLAITKTVSESFYAVYQQTLSVQIAHDEYISQKKNYELTVNKVEADILSKDQLYQAELNMLNSQVSYDNSKVTLESRLDQFKQLIGIPISEELSIIADVSYNPIDVDLQRAIDHGIAHRMELRQREIEIENSQFNLIKTTATNEFFGNINLAVGLIGTNEELDKVFHKPQNNQEVSLSFDIPLFDWGEREHRLNAAETSIAAAELSREDEEIGILVSLRQVYRNLQNLETQIKISEISERNAQLSYDINLERYSNGDLSSIDLERFQSQLSQAKLSRINALINYKLELLNMKIQSLWDFELDSAVIPKVNLTKD